MITLRGGFGEGVNGVSAWTSGWTKLGIKHHRTERGHPEQNGSHERMHRTLKDATLRPPAATGQEQQARFDPFRCETPLTPSR